LAIVTYLLQTVEICLSCGTNAVVYRLRDSDDLKSNAHECGINAIFSPLR